jgi:hypothetical protein
MPRSTPPTTGDAANTGDAAKHAAHNVGDAASSAKNKIKNAVK